MKPPAITMTAAVMADGGAERNCSAIATQAVHIARAYSRAIDGERHNPPGGMARVVLRRTGMRREGRNELTTGRTIAPIEAVA